MNNISVWKSNMEREQKQKQSSKTTAGQTVLRKRKDEKQNQENENRTHEILTDMIQKLFVKTNRCFCPGRLITQRHLSDRCDVFSVSFNVSFGTWSSWRFYTNGKWTNNSVPQCFATAKVHSIIFIQWKIDVDCVDRYKDKKVSMSRKLKPLFGAMLNTMLYHMWAADNKTAHVSAPGTRHNREHLYWDKVWLWVVLNHTHSLAGWSKIDLSTAIHRFNDEKSNSTDTKWKYRSDINTCTPHEYMLWCRLLMIIWIKGTGWT